MSLLFEQEAKICSEVAGMMITPESLELQGEQRQPVGSVLIVEAETLEEARTMMESDIYYTSGVVSCFSFAGCPLSRSAVGSG